MRIQSNRFRPCCFPSSWFLCWQLFLYRLLPVLLFFLVLNSSPVTACAGVGSGDTAVLYTSIHTHITCIRIQFINHISITTNTLALTASIAPLCQCCRGSWPSWQPRSPFTRSTATWHPLWKATWQAHIQRTRHGSTTWEPARRACVHTQHMRNLTPSVIAPSIIATNPQLKPPRTSFWHRRMLLSIQEVEVQPQRDIQQSTWRLVGICRGLDYIRASNPRSLWNAVLVLDVGRISNPPDPHSSLPWRKKMRSIPCAASIPYQQIPTTNPLLTLPVISLGSNGDFFPPIYHLLPFPAQRRAPCTSIYVRACVRACVRALLGRFHGIVNIVTSIGHWVSATAVAGIMSGWSEWGLEWGWWWWLETQALSCNEFVASGEIFVWIGGAGLERASATYSAHSGVVTDGGRV